MSGLVNLVSQLPGCRFDQFSVLSLLHDVLVHGFAELIQFLARHAVFVPGVGILIHCLHLHLAQGDDVRAGDDPDILAANRRAQPSAQVLLGVRDR